MSPTYADATATEQEAFEYWASLTDSATDQAAWDEFVAFVEGLEK